MLHSQPALRSFAAFANSRYSPWDRAAVRYRGDSRLLSGVHAQVMYRRPRRQTVVDGQAETDKYC